MATTLFQKLKSFLTDTAPGILTTWGNPGAPDIGETDWSGVIATGAAVDEAFDLLDGELLIGKTGTSGLANHPVKATITGSNGVGITNGPGTIDAHLDVTGDISAVAGAVTVEAVQGTPFSPVGPTNDQIPRYNSTSGEAEWQDAITNLPATPTQKGIGYLSVVAVDPANPIFVGDNDPRFTAGTPLTAGHIFVGNISGVAADVTMSGDASITNSGAVTVEKVNGITITGTPAIGDVPTATSTSAAHWAAPPGGSSNATQIRGITVSTTAPTITDQGYFYNSTTNQWELKFINLFSGARGNVTVSKTLANNTSTKITFDGTDFDQTGFWTSFAPTKLTAPSGAAGFYLLTGSVRFTNVSTGGTGEKKISIRVNNVDVVMNDIPTVDSGNGWCLTASIIHHLAAGDYVELVAYQNTGVTMNAGDAAGNATLSIGRLGT